MRFARVAAWLLVLAAIVAATAPHARAASMESKTFTARHKAIDDLVALIQPVISEQGSYAVQPRVRAVTVTDTPETLARIESLVAAFDTPPRGIRLVMMLMRAEEGQPADTPATRTARRAGLPPAVIQDVTRWGVVTSLGSASIETTEGGTGSVVLGGDYRARFTAGLVSSGNGVIRLERFVLEKLKPGPSAPGEPASAPSRWSPLMDLVLNLKDRQTTVLGATSSQDSKQALFVSITATAEEP